MREETQKAGPHPADLVKALRALLGWTQEQLAERCEIDRRYINKIETGRNRCSTSNMRKALARGFGLPRDDFDMFIEGKLAVDATKALIDARKAS